MILQGFCFASSWLRGSGRIDGRTRPRGLLTLFAIALVWVPGALADGALDGAPTLQAATDVPPDAAAIASAPTALAQSVGTPVAQPATEALSDVGQAPNVNEVVATSGAPTQATASADDRAESAAPSRLGVPVGDSLASLPSRHLHATPAKVVGVLAPIRSGLIGAIAARFPSQHVAEQAPRPAIPTHRPATRLGSAGDPFSGFGSLLLFAPAALCSALTVYLLVRRGGSSHVPRLPAR